MKRVVLALAPLTLVAGVTALSASGCEGKSPPAGGGPDATTGTITIGVIDSLTGGLSGLGVGLNQVVGVAARQINRVGLAGGHQVVFDVRDDTSDPSQSVIAAQALLAEGVAGILGPISSEEVFEVQPLTYNAKVLQISATATSIQLDWEPPPIYFFRTAPPDSLQAVAVVDYMRKGIVGLPLAGDGGEDGSTSDAGGGDAATGPMLGGKCKNAYVVNGDDAYGTSLGNSMLTQFPAAGGAIAGQDQVPTKLQSDYSTVIGHIAVAQPDCVILIVYSDVGAEFMRELEADGRWHGVVCGTDGEYDANFIPDGQSNPQDPKSPNSTAGFTGTSPDSAPATQEYEAFRAIWQESYPGTEPPIYGANQYDATILLALAIEKAWKDGISVRDGLEAVSSHTPPDGGASDDAGPDAAPSAVFRPDEVVEALDAISREEPIAYKGASGDCAFNDEGDVKTSYIVWKVVQQQDQTYAFETIARIQP